MDWALITASANAAKRAPFRMCRIHPSSCVKGTLAILGLDVARFELDNMSSSRPFVQIRFELLERLFVTLGLAFDLGMHV